MSKNNEYLGEAYDTLVKLSADDEKRREYELREKAIRDYNSQMASARKFGMEQGIQEGLQLAKKIFKLSIQGKTAEEIAELCDIPIEKVRLILD